MSGKERLIGQALSAALVLLSVAVFAMGQARPGNNQPNTQPAEAQSDPSASFKSNPRQRSSSSPATRREENKKPADATRYSYEFTQPQFYIPRILIEHDASGQGKITFERLGETTPIVEPVELSTAALGRILGLWSELRFLDSTENYQAAKQYSHLGTMWIKMESCERKRTAEFNCSDNKSAWALVNEYRRVANQAIFIFDINVAREIQPLNAPQLMDELEMYYTRNDLSDPQQLVPLLKELRTDEHIPLMARNHADRLLKKIEK